MAKDRKGSSSEFNEKEEEEEKEKEEAPSRRDHGRKSKRRNESDSEDDDEDDDDYSSERDSDRKHSRSKTKKRKMRTSRSSKRSSRRRYSDDDSSSSCSESDSEASESESESGGSSRESDSEEERRRRRKRRERRRKEREYEKEKRRRRRKEKEMEKKKKRKKDKEGKDKKKKKGDVKGAVTNSWGKYGIIRETDMWNKRPEFTAWLQEIKKVNLESLPNWEEKQMFKEFMEDHNTATFPSKKYYNLDAYHRHKIEKEVKRGSKKVQQTERLIFNDEEQRRLEMMQVREKQKEQEVETLKRAMQSGMAQAMKEQAQLREEMAYQYKLGNLEAAAAIQRRLDPDVAM